MLLSIHPIPARSPAEREFVGMVGETQGKVEEDGHDVIHEKQGREKTWWGITRDWVQLYKWSHM